MGSSTKSKDGKEPSRPPSETDRAELALDRGARRLTFPREFEQVFRVKHYRQTIRSIRWALALGVIIYMLFGLVDLEIPMPERLYAEVIRYGIVTPFIVLIILLSFRPGFQKIYVPFMCFGMLLVGIAVTTTNALHDAPSSWYQQTSMMLVLLFNYIFTRLRFWQATIISITVTVVSLTINWFITKTPASFFAYIALCLLSANLFGMFAAYLIEYYQRRHFLEERRRGMEKLKFKRLSDELRSSTNRDQLTGIANRYCFEEALEKAYQKAIEKDHELTVFLVDVDHFKEYNDLVGHREGDRCLKAVAKTLANMPHRPGDMVARYAGAEFAILLPNTEAAAARELIEPLIKAVAALGVRSSVSTVGEFVTVSAGGVNVQPQIGGHGSMLLDESRAMLKRAREQGRNRVVMNVDAQDAAALQNAVDEDQAAAPAADTRTQVTLVRR